MEQAFPYGKGLPYGITLQALFELPYWAQRYQNAIRDKM